MKVQPHYESTYYVDKSVGVDRLFSLKIKIYFVRNFDKNTTCLVFVKKSRLYLERYKKTYLYHWTFNMRCRHSETLSQ